MEEVKPGGGFPVTPFLAVVIAIAAIGLAWLIFNGSVAQQSALNAEISRLDADIAQLQRREAELQFRRGTLLYDGEALEREIRRQLGYVRSGEVPLVQTAPFDLSARFNEAAVPALPSPPWIMLGIKAVLALLALSLIALAVGCVLEGRGRPA